MAKKSKKAMHRQLVAKAFRNAAFRRKLLKSPHQALAAEGFKVPKGTRVKVVENTPKRVHLVLPSRAKVGKMGASFTYV